MNQFKIKKGLIVNGDGGTILDIQGSNGELFSVNDNFSGVLFSVNNISGLPIMTVSSDNSIVMGQFGLNVLTLIGNSVGIGTASPTANLHVVGNARVTGAILDSTNAPGTSGQVLTSTVTGTDWKSLAEISGVDGTGTANYLSKWADADTITNSIVYDNGTNVGIGTASPAARFTVQTTTSSSAHSLRVTDGTGVINIGHWDTVTNRFELSGKPTYFIQYGTANYISFGTLGSENMRIQAGGNVGIGTTSPASLLNLSATTLPVLTLTRQDNSTTAAGAINFSATSNVRWQISTSQAVGNGLEFNTGDATGNVMYITRAGNVGIGTTSPNSQLDAYTSQGGSKISTTHGTSGSYPKVSGISFGATSTSLTVSNNGSTTSFTGGAGIYANNTASSDNPTDLVFWNTSGGSPSERMRITSGGNVGIGTTAPSEKLSVDGRITMTGAELSFSGDEDKNITVFANRALRFNTNDTERMRITSGGNVGIGTTSPDSILHVNGTRAHFGTGVSDIKIWGTPATGGNFNIGQSSATGRINFVSSADANLVTITNAGNVGIGTTAPVGILHLYRAAAATRLAIDGDAGQNRLISYRTGALQRFGLYVDNTVESGSNAGSNFAIRAYSDAGTLLSTPFFINRATGNVGIGTSSPIAISGYTSLDINNVTNGGLIQLSRAGVGYGQLYNNASEVQLRSIAAVPLVFGTNSSERMRITSGGNVGIGTTAPGTKLQVEGTIRATGASGIVDVDPLYGAFRFYNGSTFYGGFYNDAVLSAGNAVDLVSYVATGNYYIGSATTAKAVKVEQGGNVGIGTTSPTTKLDVNGVVNATSFSAGGTAGFTGTVVFATNPPGSQMLDFQGGLLVSVS